ncbi:hypothetical protein [uncultured Tenacibaculum sp.]|uniref:hypothetical protein n=1 Tax=uncultured Tenacibaculum sp. TaxID=174713 RepID=UPI00262D791A|nr:hypothetical protein [uncultured Tenacibaculum sp.]
MKNTVFVLLVLMLYSCSTRIKSTISNTSFNALEKTQEIIILEKGKLPERSIFIGDLKIGDSGFTVDCDYNKVMNDAKIAARKAGGNIIEIIELKDPNFGSTCYRLKAKIYRNFDAEKLSPIVQEFKERNKSRLPINADYAKVYFYRPSLVIGSLIGYKIRVNKDSVVCRVRNGEKCELTITDFRKHKFWAKIDTKDSIVLDVKRGQEYFVRCSVGLGVFAGKPELNLMENHKAIEEFEKMKN